MRSEDNPEDTEATIPATILRATDEREARRVEIAENLHRRELPKLERSKQIAEWINLTQEHRAKKDAKRASYEEEEEAERVSSQAETKLAGRPESGVNAAARELGISQAEAHRSVKIASLSPEAMNAARQVGLDDNQSVLVAVAKLPSEQQESKLRQIAKARHEQEQQRYRRKMNEERQSERERARSNPAVMLILEHLGDKVPDLLTAMVVQEAPLTAELIAKAAGVAWPSTIAGWAFRKDTDWHAAWAKREQED
jgi:hypothetical protein